MATYRILQDAHPYYTLEVAFGDEVFVQQTLFPHSTAAARAAAMRNYANSYEADYVEEVVDNSIEPSDGIPVDGL